ncbi:MAG TPA: DUF2383 domain-containing protein [Marinobacter sp.]|nr:DUF2383 domain-containing protein [Marinobacter sp.]
MSMVLNSDTIIKKLSNLVELDFDAVAAYKEAIERIENPSFKATLGEFMLDHERHIADLSEIIRKEGGTPPDSGDFKKILTKGKVQLADLVGDDKAILKAMKLNEDQTTTMYQERCEEDFPNHIHTVLQKGLEDERRHRAWIVTTIEQYT